MQLNWDTDFFQRVFFNASKAYVRQLKDGELYKLLQPVYSLNFVNGDLHKGLAESFDPMLIAEITGLTVDEILALYPPCRDVS